MIFVKINQYEVFTKKYPWRLKANKPSSVIAQLPHMHAVRSLRSNQVWSDLGRYVATERVITLTSRSNFGRKNSLRSVWRSIDQKLNKNWHDKLMPRRDCLVVERPSLIVWSSHLYFGRIFIKLNEIFQEPKDKEYLVEILFRIINQLP